MSILEAFFSTRHHTQRSCTLARCSLWYLPKSPVECCWPSFSANSCQFGTDQALYTFYSAFNFATAVSQFLDTSQRIVILNVVVTNTSGHQQQHQLPQHQLYHIVILMVSSSTRSNDSTATQHSQPRCHGRLTLMMSAAHWCEALNASEASETALRKNALVRPI